MSRIEEKFRYTQLPVPTDIADYDKARQWIVSYVSENKDVVSVYEYGTVTAPGISDLDLIVVLRDKPEGKEPSSRLVLDDAPEFVSRFLDRDVLKAVCREHFRDLNILGEISLKLLIGPQTPFRQMDEGERRFFLICDLMDWLAERTSVILYFQNSKEIPVTDFLCYLKSFCISVQIAYTILGQRSGVGLPFCDKVHALRRGWFENSEFDNLNKLQRLIYDGIEVGFELMDLVSEYLIENEFYTPTEVEEASYFYFNRERGYIFASEKNSETDVPTGESTLIKTPKIWLTHLLYSSRQEGTISRRIANNLRINGPYKKGLIHPELMSAVDKRMSLCNTMAEYAKEYGLEKGLYRYAHIKELKNG